MEMFDKRIEESKAFLSKVKEEFNDYLSKDKVEVGLSSKSTPFFFGEKKGFTMRCGYSIIETIHQMNEDLLLFLRQEVLPRLAVGGFGSIFTSFFEYKGVSFKVTMNNYNQLIGDENDDDIVYFDVCTIEEY